MYYTDQNLVNQIDNNQDGAQSLAEAENKFMHFIRETQVRNTYIYREQMKGNAQRGQYYLRINVRDLNAFDEQLYTLFKNAPTDYIKVFEAAIETIYKVDYYDESNPAMEPCPKF